MPTPSDDTIPVPHALEPSASHASFTSCPPEDDRDSQDHDVSAAAAQPHELGDEHMTSRNTTSEPDTQPGVVDSSPSPASLAPAEPTDEVVAAPDTSNPLSPNDGDANLAQSMSSAAISTTPSPLYLYYPQTRHRNLTNATTSFLHPGSKFRGTQQSDRQVYDVQVEIKDVDMSESFLCGYLRIQGLTDDHPTLTTFFEGEIIGPKYLFKTTHPSWGSSEKVDLQHWARFPAWRPLAKSAKSPNFTLKNYQQREHLFMRWKEYFLVPDHRVKTITGASFEGFYYICFNQCNGNVSGIYFHAKSEKYQQLELQHVEDHGCQGAMEFR